MKIAIDLDDTISDLLGAWVKAANEVYGYNVSVEDIKSWDMTHYFDCGDSIFDLLTPELFENVKIKEDAKEVLKKLNEAHDIYIVTSSVWYPDTMASKVRWIERELSFLSMDQVIMCGNDKSMIRSDYMIDDKIDNIVAFKGKGILFDAPHNREYIDVPRVRDWIEVGGLFGVIGSGVRQKCD